MIHRFSFSGFTLQQYIWLFMKSMMNFQHKINVLVLYPIRETTNKKYFLCIFTFWSSEKQDIQFSSPPFRLPVLLNKRTSQERCC